jgi:rhodanese-related sulfurtransferase
MTPDQAKELLDRGELVLIDVRTDIERAAIHAVGSVHIPLDQFDAQDVLKRYDGKIIACICKAGNRSPQAVDALLQAGATRVANVLGGTEAWARAGLPVERQSRVIPLERQVLIAAGMLVLVGVILGYAVHPWGFALSGFIGAGLIFAGSTGFCGMGLLLAKMPWNRVHTRCSDTKDRGGSCVVS